jgi:uncharacterized membrane protein YfcA
VAVFAACFDAIAGGGGLVTVPALLLAGMDPVSAIATNKLQAAAGTVSSAAAFSRRGLVDWRLASPVMAAAVAGSIVGALSVSVLPASVLKALVPLLLITIALYFANSDRRGDSGIHARLSPFLFAFLVVPVIGFYDGVFGPGAGSFYMAAFMGLLGCNILKATAHTKLANAASNLGSLCLFALKGNVVLEVGLVMAVGAILGAQIGSALAVRFGSRLVRPLLVSISVIMAVRLLLMQDNPLRIMIGNLYMGAW